MLSLIKKRGRHNFGTAKSCKTKFIQLEDLILLMYTHKLGPIGGGLEVDKTKTVTSHQTNFQRPYIGDCCDVGNEEFEGPSLTFSIAITLKPFPKIDPLFGARHIQVRRMARPDLSGFTNLISD